MKSKKVAVIGGGAAGLCAARHCTAHDGIAGGVTIFEQTSQLGGIWVYTEQTDTDRFGLPVHSSMYKNLRTNLPKEVMGFPDFLIPEKEKSYLPRQDILQFLNDYADRFDLRKNIKYNHLVKNVTPLEDGSWELQITDLTTNTTSTERFDAVMVCNGHYHTPMNAVIQGIETFPGTQLHSHHYRKPEKFTGQSVLVIGGGPSGLDIALDISHFANKVIISHHVEEEIKTQFPSNITQKPDIRSIKNNTVIFKDGSEEDVDVILYCTGYKYNFPFLSEECGVLVDDNFVQPLYKHLIHIYRPTMCFVGIPFYVCTFMMFDLQVRVFLKVLFGEVNLPSCEEMEADVQREVEWRTKLGLRKKHFHMMGEFQGGYYEELSEFGKVSTINKVYVDLHNESKDRFLEDLVNFREDVYVIKDSETYVKIK